MSDNLMSRRKFLVSAGTVAAAAGLAGVGLAKSAQPAAAVTAAAALPWPYPTTPAEQPDPEILARRAYEVYYAAGCAEATWCPIVEFLAEKPTPTHVRPMGHVSPRRIQVRRRRRCRLGHSVRHVQRVCRDHRHDGRHPRKITDEVMQYYGETPLPTNGMDKARGGRMDSLRVRWQDGADSSHERPDLHGSLPALPRLTLPVDDDDRRG